MAGGNLNLQGVNPQSLNPSSNAARSAQVLSAGQGEDVRLRREQEEQPASQERALRAEEFTREELREIADSFGEAVGLLNRGVRIQVDEDSNRFITQVIDRESDEVIRQIPPQELLEISSRLRRFVGALLDIAG